MSRSCAAGLDDILITDQLAVRPTRLPDLAAENRGLSLLAQEFARGAEGVFQTLVCLAVELCQAGTGGVSLVETTGEGERVFRWVAMAGALASFVGGATPRDFSPCGVTLARGGAQLFTWPGRYFTYFDAVSSPIVEGVVVPLGTGEDAPGTIWVVSHTQERQFDQEDVRIMTCLAAFTAAAWRLQATAAENARLAAQAQAALRTRDDLIELLSHDLRSPLTAIKGQAQILQRRVTRAGGGDAAALLTGLTIITDAATRVAAQIDDLRGEVRSETGAAVHTQGPTDLVALVRALVAERQGSEGGRLQLECPHTGIVGDWDRGHLARVLENLLGNALKYSPDGGQVVVRVTREADCVVVAVQDHGIGIPAADLPRIFQRGYRGSNVDDHIAGTGLGLAGAIDSQIKNERPEDTDVSGAPGPAFSINT